MVRRLEGRSQFTSMFTPICDSDFVPGTIDRGFKAWAGNGLSRLCDLMDDGSGN